MNHSQDFWTDESTDLGNLESEVRGYCRLFPATFETASGSTLVDTSGKSYIDFFSGAGSLNYGHNPPVVKAALIDYLQKDGITNSLDMMSTAKAHFLNKFETTILRPRGLRYKLQFTGPTGTNAVEAATKLARKKTGRSHVIAFTRAYHGHTLGALALTANQAYHDQAYGAHHDVTHLPFDGYLGNYDTSIILERMLADRSSGTPLPAAVILETVQGEGGVNVASQHWLTRVQSICREHGVLLIVDDIQVGIGRTGDFFSFESAGLYPDIVCLSKSIGGGLPMSLVLIAPDCDVWQPGQHTGTFRGNNLAFVAATAALEFWASASFKTQLAQRASQLEAGLHRIASQAGREPLPLRGRGMIWGLGLGCGNLARRVTDQAFSEGLIIESAGPHDEVLKFLPALNISAKTLARGLQIISSALDRVLPSTSTVPAASQSETTELLTTNAPVSL